VLRRPRVEPVHVCVSRRVFVSCASEYLCMRVRRVACMRVAPPASRISRYEYNENATYMCECERRRG
jgi:hypothetical protein